MWKPALLITAIASSAGCAQPDAPEHRQSGNTAFGPVTSGIESEALISESEAAKLSDEFDIALCSGITRLRDVRSNAYFAQSWRVPEGGQCAKAWSDRQARYSILAHLDMSQAERDRLPWLCSEAAGHVAECVRQGGDMTLVMQQPRDERFILLRRIAKVAK